MCQKLSSNANTKQLQRLARLLKYTSSWKTCHYFYGQIKNDFIYSQIHNIFIGYEFYTLILIFQMILSDDFD